MTSIRTQHLGTITILAVEGRMDSTARDLLLTTLDSALADPDQQIVLDLAEVTYISTSGLKMLRRLKDVRGSVHIARMSDRVRDVLLITGLDMAYALYDTPIEAFHAAQPVVNAHTHLEQGWLSDIRPSVSGADFTGWLFGKVSGRAAALGSQREKVTRAAAERGIEALIQAGTTMIGDISLNGVSIEPLLESGLRGVVYVEVLGYTPDSALARWQAAQALIDKWRPKERNGLRIGLAPHTPYTLHPSLWPQMIEFARREALPVCIHAAESPAEHEAFTRGTGPVVERWRERGMAFTPPMKSPIAYLDEIGALALQPLLVHCVQVDDDDVRRIQASGAAVAHCPRSNLRLRCGRMPLEKFLAAGVRVYLGTDGLGSSPTLNVLDELEVAVALHHGHVPAEQLTGLIHQTL